MKTIDTSTVGVYIQYERVHVTSRHVTARRHGKMSRTHEKDNIPH